MAKKKIFSVEFSFPGNMGEYVSFDSDTSLLDADIIIFCPLIHSFSFQYDSRYQGKPALKDTASFSLQEKCDHWRRELVDACKAGKTIFIFLEKFDSLFVSTGKKEFSGTGRNRLTTNLVTEYDNYKSIPFPLDPVNSKGLSMILGKGSEVIANYWKEFADFSEYHVYLNGKVSQTTITTKNGGRVVGGIIRSESSNGVFVLLPHLKTDFEEKNDEGELFWTEKGVEFGHKLLASLVEIDKIIKHGSKVSPMPDWVAHTKFTLPKEQKIRDELLKIESNIQQHQEKKNKLKEDLAGESKLKKLLYEKGKPLEEAIIQALQILGFNAAHFQDSESEFDVMFGSPEGRLIGEAEGKDKKQINITKLRQLEMNIHEDFEREEVNEIAKGVLFGNAFRILPLEERDQNFFTKKCITASKRNGTALVRTTDLFLVSAYMLKNKNKTFAKKCRKAILEAEGDIVQFPEVKEEKVKKPVMKKT